MSEYRVCIDQKCTDADVHDNAVVMTIDNLMDAASSFRLLVDTVLGFGSVGTRISITKVSEDKPTKTDMEKTLQNLTYLTGGMRDADS